MKNEDSITGAYLSGKLKIPVPLERRKPTGFLTVKGAAENNLKNIDVKIPLGIMTCITGVSGSGKSSLINEILYKRLARDLNRARVITGKNIRIFWEQTNWIRLSILTSHLLAVLHVPILRLIPGYLTRSEIFLQQQQMPRQKGYRKDDSVLM
mgnify:CR=1 FL=1